MPFIVSSESATTHSSILVSGQHVLTVALLMPVGLWDTVLQPLLNMGTILTSRHVFLAKAWGLGPAAAGMAGRCQADIVNTSTRSTCCPPLGPLMACVLLPLSEQALGTTAW